MAARIGIVNYGMGNLRSVEKALERVGAEVTISGEGQGLDQADGLILPGVGAFGAAMRRIRESGLDHYLRSRAGAGTPLLGVCLGMQLLFGSSEEGDGDQGLDLLPGVVTRLEAPGLKLPHIGWSPLRRERDSALTEEIVGGEPFYFVHSFVARPRASEQLASAAHGERFAALVGSGNIFGAQFHPEKSSEAGLQLLRNFTSICARAGAVAGG